MSNGFTYKDAGVDRVTKDLFTASIRPLMRGTFGPRVMELPDGFAGLCALKTEGLLHHKYRNPVLASSAAGVGTKLKIAFMLDKHDTVGVDLVAMSVNDLITVGAEPLYFLDHISIGKLDSAKLTQVVKGIADGCAQAHCSLIGGGTAEMTDFHAEGEYDLTGFATGVVERSRTIDGQNIRPKDLVIGVASSGLHSNGYTLVRRVFLDHAKMGLTDMVPDLGCPLGEELLRPTRIYAEAIQRVVAHYKRKHIVHGIAHIAGGGLRGSLLRILPEGYGIRLRNGAWPVPPIFPFLQRTGSIVDEEMRRVFNMGVGMALIVPPFNADMVLDLLRRSGETAWVIGEVVKAEREVMVE